MEAFGKVHPLHRNYHQWLQMSEHERELPRRDLADLYIFSTSNCIYTGMPLARYELMLDVWRKEGNYAGVG